MIYAAIICGLMSAFWGYASFIDARWKADETGPSVWEYAFPGIVMCGISGLACLVLLAVFLLGGAT
ncbi:hypothetical protein [Rhizobium phage RHph_X2_25]|nr:hypothetical protein [Rhizobium phage RHph_X2_25]